MYIYVVIMGLVCLRNSYPRRVIPIDLTVRLEYILKGSDSGYLNVSLSGGCCWIKGHFCMSICFIRHCTCWTIFCSRFWMRAALILSSPSNIFLFITLFKRFFHLSDCSSVHNNTLKSPGYPGSYPTNMFCVYRVPIPCNKELVIYFNSFHLENHVFCW